MKSCMTLLARFRHGACGVAVATKREKIVRWIVMARLESMDPAGVCAEGCYGALRGARGFEPPADPITLGLRPAGAIFWMVFMPGSAPWATASAASIQVGGRVDRRRNARVDFA
jgi:hypothetical protein